MTKEEARKILNVNILATESEIKNAFRNLAKQYHPDVSQNQESNQNFIDAHQAYEILLGKRKAEEKKIYKSKTAENQFRYSNPRTHSNRNFDEYDNLSYEERMRRAQKTVFDMDEANSEKIYQKVFDEYMHGWKRKAVKISASVGLLMILVISFNRFYPPFFKIYQANEYEVMTDNYFPPEYYLRIDKQIFNISSTQAIQLISNNKPLKTYTSVISKDIIAIQSDGLEKTNTSATKIFFNVYQHFYVYLLIFIFPIFVYFNEKPNFNFLFFGVYGSIYFIPLVIIGILQHENRILRMLGI